MKHLTKNIIIGIAALCLMAYSAVQISLTVGDMVEVENAVYSTSSKSIPANAYIFRDEHPVIISGNGSACYFFSDGEKVPKNAEILRIYSLDTDAKIQEEINILNKKIAVLEKSSITKTYSTTDLESLDSSIAAKIYNIISAVGEGSLNMASLNEDDLLILMNRRTSVLTAAGGYDYVIDIYKSRITELQKQLTGSSSVFKTEKAGYFYSSCDGYENIFTTNSLDNITMEEYYSLESKLPDDTLISRSEGKLVTSVKWYITVCLDKKTISKLTENKSQSYKYEIRFP
ncbi:MAG: HlyD family efflux transporter periplasmic adaptor subunit, partial [Eubacteriales bacterium]|nr:HlyD family efflux transporter periplasmic adaptor subunit [Eubacteriales bacterium]